MSYATVIYHWHQVIFKRCSWIAVDWGHRWLLVKLNYFKLLWFLISWKLWLTHNLCSFLFRVFTSSFPVYLTAIFQYLHRKMALLCMFLVRSDRWWLLTFPSRVHLLWTRAKYAVNIPKCLYVHKSMTLLKVLLTLQVTESEENVHINGRWWEHDTIIF